MVSLADIGRAQPAKAIQDFQVGRSVLMNQEKKRAVSDLQMKSVQQDMDIKQRQIDTQIATEAEENAPRAVEPFLSRFEGGADSPMAKLVYDMASENGLVDMSQGGLGTINAKTAKKIFGMVNEPVFASKLLRTRVDYWRGLNTQALQALNEKPDDQKIQAEVQRTTDGLNQSLAQDAGLKSVMDEQTKQRNALELEKTKQGAETETVADFEKDFLDAALEENKKTMSPVDAMKKALSDFESVKKEGKFKPGGININLGDKIQEQEEAKDKAFWTGTKAKEKAKEIARDDFGDTWEDFTIDQKNFETKKILDQKIKSVTPDAVFGEDGGVFGWYVPDESGQFKIIQRWNE